jgi:hypothetical protein
MYKKKLKTTLPSAALYRRSAKNSKKKEKNLCRVSILGRSAKLRQETDAVPINFFPSALCQVRHSAKALPSANLPLPTRQSGRIP